MEDYDDEVYVDDFELLQEVTMSQADLDQDRDDEIDEEAQPLTNESK